MNILFFLTPKENVAYVYSDYSLRQVLEKMEFHRYASIPIIDPDGRYVGTVTEGDLLWAFKEHHITDLKSMEDITVMQIRRRMNNHAVHTSVDIEDLVGNAMNQNFVPVTDDRGVFIGIVTRKQIIIFLYEQYLKQKEGRTDGKKEF